MTDTDRAEYVKGLRELADILEQVPGLPLPYQGSTTPMTIMFFDYTQDNRALMAAAASAIGGPWAKNGDDNYFDLKRDLHGLKVQLTAKRDEVCTRVVTGTEIREVEEVVTPAVTRTVTKPVEVVEWQCGSLLAERQSVRTLAPQGDTL